ncbi:hypothetical protein [Chryseobacterium hagamense]|uniref:Uncharacterized protein n=1 Tax=Chryseobacterium hagamense TaxID=395935 RepID=A0A511YSC0_9FLAO|nr:hypothetical protein [Chryseobacterium hagamense]GEN78088.1 hypothetical protein CHA01nite_38280 [Chryseobacterium hagamense]
MKNNLFNIMALLALGTLSAQVRTVNSATNISVTNSPAFIDASSNTTVNGSSNVGKGLIFPRVDLSAMTSFPGITAGIPNSFPTRFDGMIVYNTAASGTAGVGATQGTLSPGYWFYDNKSVTNTGGTWKPVSTATAEVANTASNGLTLTGNNVKIGGNLNESTTITNNGKALNIAGSASSTTFASNGNVGIGTATPAEVLDVYGNTVIRGTANIKTTAATAVVNQNVLSVENDGTVTKRFINYISNSGENLNDLVKVPYGSLITGSFVNNICNDGFTLNKRFTIEVILNYDGTFSKLYTNGPATVTVTGEGTSTIRFSYSSACRNADHFLKFSNLNGNVTITSDPGWNTAAAAYTIR